MGDIRAESRGGMDDVYRENMDLRVSKHVKTLPPHWKQWS